MATKRRNNPASAAGRTLGRRSARAQGKRVSPKPKGRTCR
jgi:hypothetical protein